MNGTALRLLPRNPDITMPSKNCLFWVVSFFLLAGCAGDRRIGARTFPLTIKTSHNGGVEFSGATVYIIPADEWPDYKKDINDPVYRKFVTSYHAGLTPLTINGISIGLVVVVEWNNRLTKAYSLVVPGQVDPPFITIEVKD